MAYSVTVTKHNVAFPSKIRSGGDGHTLNMFVAADTDNGVVGSVGAWKDFDRYTFTAGNTSFQGKLHAAANGNWYVELLEDTDAIWIYDAVVIPEDYNREFSKESNFYNESGKTVKGYSLHKGDILELATACFDGTPAKNSAVGYDATKNLYTV